jgi:hypothetical protein
MKRSTIAKVRRVADDARGDPGLRDNAIEILKRVDLPVEAPEGFVVTAKALMALPPAPEGTTEGSSS